MLPEPPVWPFFALIVDVAFDCWFCRDDPRPARHRAPGRRKQNTTC